MKKELDSFGINLVKIFEQHFSDLQDIKDHRKFRAILNDYFPEKKKEINLLILLIQVGLVDDLISCECIDMIFVNRYIYAMDQLYGTSLENADYAVKTWCLCLGKYILGKNCNVISYKNEE